MFLSPLGERLGEGVNRRLACGITPSPSLSPKGERSVKEERGVSSCEAMTMSIR